MTIPRWNPPQHPSRQEQFLLRRLTRTRKLFGFLREHRHELFDDAFQDELETMYRDTGAGKEPLAPAQLAMGILLQGYVGASDAEAVELTVVDPFPVRRELAMRLGAQHAFGPEDPLEQREFDIAIEASGNAQALNTAINSVAFGATVVVCSWYGTKPAPLVLGGAFHRRRLRIVSSQVGTIDAALQPRWSRERRMRLALELLPSMPLEPLISHRVPFDEAARAYRLVDECPDQTVQVVLTYAA